VDRQKQFDRELGWHRGYEFDGLNAFFTIRTTGDFFVVWSVGLAEGAKYDVKASIRVRYWGLRQPPN